MWDFKFPSMYINHIFPCPIHWNMCISFRYEYLRALGIYSWRRRNESADHEQPWQWYYSPCRIYRIMHELPWIMIYGHEWGDLPMIFMSDEVTSENHWQIASGVIKKNNYSRCIISFLTCYFMSWTYNSAKNNHQSLISPLKQLHASPISVLCNDCPKDSIRFGNKSSMRSVKEITEY